MTDKTFDPNEYIEQATDIVRRLEKYMENNTPSPELVDAAKELYSDLSKFYDMMKEVETK